jgi:hypothetical protein
MVSSSPPYTLTQANLGALLMLSKANIQPSHIQCLKLIGVRDADRDLLQMGDQLKSLGG